MNEAGFNADVIEAALAHSEKNEVRRAYNRSTYLVLRQELMTWWSNLVYNQFIIKPLEVKDGNPNIRSE